MDHVVYLDAKAGELDKLIDGSKSMIIRGAAGRKMPHGRVNEGDTLYFINNNAEGIIKAGAIVKSVFNSEKMTTEESMELVRNHQETLQLSESQLKRWAGKRYIVLIGLDEFKVIDSFEIDKSAFGNMDDWLPVGRIDDIRK